MLPEGIRNHILNENPNSETVIVQGNSQDQMISEISALGCWVWIKREKSCCLAVSVMLV